MLDQIFQWDKDIFLALNFDGGEVLDQLFSIVSGKLTWVPLYILIIVLLWRRYGWKNMLIAVAFIALAVGLTDQVSNIFKNYLPKLRPSWEPDLQGMVHTVGGRMGGRYGTMSAHAATTFSIMIFSTALIRKRWFTITAIIWVLLVCYSRIYLGLHYPMDILIGALFGTVTGILFVKLYRWVVNKLQERCEKPPVREI